MVVDVGTPNVSMASASRSQFAMNPTAISMLTAVQRVTNTSSGAPKHLGSDIKACVCPL